MDPKHVAIIMDGNGRWAKRRGRPRVFGHIKGARVAKAIITHCANRGLEVLTLYAFSSENWLRPPEEVGFLMHLLRRYLRRETDNLLKLNVRFTVIGDIDRLPGDVRAAIEHTKRVTSDCTGLQVVFAISYGSRQEMTQAIRRIAIKVRDGEFKPEDVDEFAVARELQTQEIPDPDLILRTSGEQRLSNFLLWQAAYSEFHFTSTLWPDFTEQEFSSILNDYQKRDRRFGMVKSLSLELQN